MEALRLQQLALRRMPTCFGTFNVKLDRCMRQRAGRLGSLGRRESFGGLITRGDMKRLTGHPLVDADLIRRTPDL